MKRLVAVLLLCVPLVALVQDSKEPKPPTLRSILLELKKDLRFINAPSSQVAASRKDIHEIFEAEWARLDRAERSALGVLARHDGPLDLTTVCAVTDADGPRVLLRLVNKSLLRRSADGSLALHPLLRQFVRLKGQATG